MKNFDEVMMRTAYEWAIESYCKRGKVGAILSREGRIVTNGYNGTISGMCNDCEDEFIKCRKCSSDNPLNRNNIYLDSVHIYKFICTECYAKHDYSDMDELEAVIELKTNQFTLHAEQNLIAFAAKYGIATAGCTLYTTKSPCKECSKLIAQSGIVRVVYDEEYHDTAGIDFLRKVGVLVDKLERK